MADEAKTEDAKKPAEAEKQTPAGGTGAGGPGGGAPGAGGPGGGNRPGRRPKRKSRFGTQLEEKQQLKELYGLREGPLRRYYVEAQRAAAETGPQMISLMERRLDNAVYRAGWAETRKMARQLATHGIFEVNGRRVDVPSYRLRKGDVITIKESKRKKSPFANFEKRMQNVTPPAWLRIAPADFAVTVEGEPTADEAGVGVDIQAIVEYLAR